jgi:hypothetical protein
MTQENSQPGTVPITPQSGSDVSSETSPVPDPQPPVAPPDRETEQGNSLGIVAPRHDESDIWRERYEPVAVPPADARLDIGQAGLVASHVGKVYIKPEIRVQDVLSGGPVNRVGVRDDPFYLEAREWQQAWQEAVKALDDKGVVIVVAPRGYGSTAFALRLLACHAPENAELIRLEADWDSPKVGKLPLLEDRAYQLDLQDPEQDRFDGAFLSGLGKQSTQLKALRSCLVLAVANEFWPGHSAQIPSEVGVVWLEAPPDPLLLVERYLTTKQLDRLIPYVQQDEAVRHIQGRNAVQTMRAVDVVIGQWQAYLRRPEAEIASLHSEAAFPEPQHGPPHLDPGLKQAIEQALGDWQDDLDALFGEPGPGAGSTRSLPPEDRCLLMSLAILQSGTAAEIEAVALSLERSLDKGRGRADETVDAWSVLSRRGLRPRLKNFDADIDGRDRVTFNKPGYGEAVLAYVWRNYSRLRDDLITWMVQSAPASGESPDRATKTLAALIRRLQDAERLTQVRDEAVREGRTHVIVRVMAEAATDEHIGHRARTLLYKWASQRPDSQIVVVSVCRALIGDKTDAALVRLGRVASQADDPEVSAAVLSAFRAVIADLGDTDRFVKAVATWQKPNPRAARLGLLALLATETNGHLWIPSDVTEIDLAAGLRDLLAKPSFFSATVPALVNWLKYCARDQAPYTMALSLVAEAARDRHAFKAGMEVMKSLEDIEGPNGTSVGEDLYIAFGRPELRSAEPLTRAEA